jgi:hypothetical protein
MSIQFSNESNQKILCEIYSNQNLFGSILINFIQFPNELNLKILNPILTIKIFQKTYFKISICCLNVPLSDFWQA